MKSLRVTDIYYNIIIVSDADGRLPSARARIGKSVTDELEGVRSAQDGISATLSTVSCF